MHKHELSQLDKKILFEMDHQARTPLSIIAKRLHTSIQVIKYRLEKLQKENIIQGYYADINSSKLGVAIYVVYFKFQNMNEDTEKLFITHIVKQKNIGLNVSVNGPWDYSIGIWAETVVQFEESYKKIMRDYEKYVRSKLITIETEFYYFKPKMFSEKTPSETQITMKGDIKRADIDEKDKKILLELSHDCRISLVDLAKKLDMTPNAIKARIKHLEKEKIILGYRIMINYPLLGYLHYRVFLHLENITEEKEKKLIGYLKYQTPVISVTKTVGYSTLEFRAIVKNVEEFYDMIHLLKGQFPDIVSIDSLIYHKFYQSLNYYPFK
ncbi:MAG: Lrp/AsnC family transcriptional regulator [Candidatus Woesearchaeota archaeon]